MKNFKLILFILGVMLLLPFGVNASSITITADDYQYSSCALDNSCETSSSTIKFNVSGTTTTKGTVTYTINGGESKTNTIAKNSDNWVIVISNSELNIDKENTVKFTVTIDNVTSEEKTVTLLVYKSTNDALTNATYGISLQAANFGMLNGTTLNVEKVSDSTISKKYENPYILKVQLLYNSKPYSYYAEKYSSNGLIADSLSGTMNVPDGYTPAAKGFDSGYHLYVLGKDYELLSTQSAVDGDTSKFNLREASWNYYYTADYMYFVVSSGAYKNGELTDTTSTKKLSNTVTTNPNTSDKNIIISVIAMITVTSIFIITYRKFKKVR